MQSNFKPKMYYPKTSKRVPATTIPAFVAIALASLFLAAAALGIIAVGLSAIDHRVCSIATPIAYADMNCDEVMK